MRFITPLHGHNVSQFLSLTTMTEKTHAFNIYKNEPSNLFCRLTVTKIIDPASEERKNPQYKWQWSVAFSIKQENESDDHSEQEINNFFTYCKENKTMKAALSSFLEEHIRYFSELKSFLEKMRTSCMVLHQLGLDDYNKIHSFLVSLLGKNLKDIVTNEENKKNEPGLFVVLTGSVNSKKKSPIIKDVFDELLKNNFLKPLIFNTERLAFLLKHVSLLENDGVMYKLLDFLIEENNLFSEFVKNDHPDSVVDNLIAITESESPPKAWCTQMWEAIRRPVLPLIKNVGQLMRVLALLNEVVGQADYKDKRLALLSKSYLCLSDWITNHDELIQFMRFLNLDSSDEKDEALRKFILEQLEESVLKNLKTKDPNNNLDALLNCPAFTPKERKDFLNMVKRGEWIQNAGHLIAIRRSSLLEKEEKRKIFIKVISQFGTPCKKSTGKKSVTAATAVEDDEDENQNLCLALELEAEELDEVSISVEQRVAALFEDVDEFIDLFNDETVTEHREILIGALYLRLLALTPLCEDFVKLFNKGKFSESERNQLFSLREPTLLRAIAAKKDAFEPLLNCGKFTDSQVGEIISGLSPHLEEMLPDFKSFISFIYCRRVSSEMLATLFDSFAEKLEMWFLDLDTCVKVFLEAQLYEEKEAQSDEEKKAQQLDEYENKCNKMWQHISPILSRALIKKPSEPHLAQFLAHPSLMADSQNLILKNDQVVTACFSAFENLIAFFKGVCLTEDSQNIILNNNQVVTSCFTKIGDLIEFIEAVCLSDKQREALLTKQIGYKQLNSMIYGEGSASLRAFLLCKGLPADSPALRKFFQASSQQFNQFCDKASDMADSDSDNDEYFKCAFNDLLVEYRIRIIKIDPTASRCLSFFSGDDPESLMLKIAAIEQCSNDIANPDQEPVRTKKDQSLIDGKKQKGRIGKLCGKWSQLKAQNENKKAQNENESESESDSQSSSKFSPRN